MFLKKQRYVFFDIFSGKIVDFYHCFQTPVSLILSALHFADSDKT